MSRTHFAWILALALTSCRAGREHVSSRASLRVELAQDAPPTLIAAGVGIEIEYAANRIVVPQAPYGAVLEWRDALGSHTRDVSFLALAMEPAAPGGTGEPGGRGRVALVVDGQRVGHGIPPVWVHGPPVGEVVTPPVTLGSVIERGFLILITCGLCLLFEDDEEDELCFQYP